MSLPKEKKVAFEAARNKIIGVDRQRLGIGTLSEKSVHAILKHYMEPDEDRHEVPVENFVADIYSDGAIIEIQTKQFYRMRDKLKTFLPLYPVTVVYPIPREKWLVWIDPETGELAERRKSPLKGNLYTIFPELYRIKMFLKDPNLKFRLVLMDMEEYKLLNGYGKDKKKRADKFDRIPTELVEEVEINCIQDYMQFVPYDLEEPFTVKNFAKAAHISVALAQPAVHILAYVGMIEKVGKKGNAHLYRTVEL
ncbi:MAG: hypothetical protein J1E64_04430 [Acetatifactor sp.]|nr:hypothetical protein [Acetatifactor sp.]